MSLQFYPTSPEDLDAISSLMMAGFKAGPEAPFLDQRLLHWKYFQPGPPWEGSRGYVLKDKGSILAHCGIWPINLSFLDKTVTCNCFMDWVSDRALPGAGFLLKRKLMTMAETAIVVGGTADTRAVVPKLGFECIGEVAFFVQIVRPWKQFRTRPTEGILRDTGRLVRNTSWSRSASDNNPPEGWSAVPVQSFNDLMDTGNGSPHPMPSRTANYLNYWLGSPTVVVTGFRIEWQNEPRGYFLLSRVGHQTRIADLRLASSKQDDWTAAYTLAAYAAADDPETCETVAVASTLFAEIALSKSRFRLRESAPFFLYDPGKKLRDSPPMFWNLIDGDAAYIQDSAHPYVA
jgi:hypothetical protein